MLQVVSTGVDTVKRMLVFIVSRSKFLKWAAVVVVVQWSPTLALNSDRIVLLLFQWLQMKIGKKVNSDFRLQIELKCYFKPYQTF